MRIRVSDLRPEGLKVNDDIPLDALNQRMNEAASNDIVFTSPPSVELTVHKTPQGAQVKGTAAARYKQPCSLCLEELERETKVKIEYVFQRKSPLELARRDDDANNFYDDVGICYFSGEHIELEELIQESLILSMTPFFRPPQNEKGECVACGINCSKLLSIGG